MGLEELGELVKANHLFDSVLHFFVWASKVLAMKSASKKVPESRNC